MPKYRYKQYLHRAFWNSLLAVLSALVVVLIIVYGWQGFKSAIDKIVPADKPLVGTSEEADQLQLLESLKGGESSLSEEEQSVALEGLKSEENVEMSSEERMKLLDSLKSDN